MLQPCTSFFKEHCACTGRAASFAAPLARLLTCPVPFSCLQIAACMVLGRVPCLDLQRAVEERGDPQDTVKNISRTPASSTTS